jgi:hypothetical protein
MKNDSYFKIKIRRKIPYATNLFLTISMVCFIVFLLFDFIYYPFKNVDRQFQGVVFGWIYPTTWRKIYVFSIVGAAVSDILFLYLRMYKSAVLAFSPDLISIRGNAIKVEILTRFIKTIVINNAKTLDEAYKEDLSVSIEYAKSQIANIKLIDYSEADDFMQHLVQYEKAKIKIYEHPFATLSDGDD